MNEKVYTVADVQNIIKSEQEKWDNETKRVFSVVQILGSKRLAMSIIGVLRTQRGLVIEVK